MIDKNMKVNLKEILDKEFPDERYSEECYLCDPDKNTLCPKEVCHINGGPCYSTTNKKFEFKRLEKTNQDILAEKVRMMHPEKLADIIIPYTELGDCDGRCPVPKEYCDRYFKFATDDEKDDHYIDRAPDENGNILDCKGIIMQWLKENAN